MDLRGPKFGQTCGMHGIKLAGTHVVRRVVKLWMGVHDAGACMSGRKNMDEREEELAAVVQMVASRDEWEEEHARVKGFMSGKRSMFARRCMLRWCEWSRATSA